MNYGILVAVAEDGSLQIVGMVDNRQEAAELTTEYITLGPESGWLAPWEFQIHKRSRTGGYTTIDHLAFADALETK